MTGLLLLATYIGLFALAWWLYSQYHKRRAIRDFTSLKTVTFGDESAVTPNRVASVVSVIVIFLLWGAFTNSKLVPIHVPGPFLGDAQFDYTAINAAGNSDDATVTMRVYHPNDSAETPQIEPGDGFAKNDAATMKAWRQFELLKVQDNDIGGEEADYKITAINGQPIAPGQSLALDGFSVALTDKGTVSFHPRVGLQMQPIYLPSPEAVWTRFIDLNKNGFRNSGLWEHVGISLWRVVVGFVLGSLVGIPLGYAMGLSGWFRGWFDPIVEFMRPVPPLALIPLVIIWFGIGETGKFVLLFLAALWIMIIAARAGVSGVNITKIHAAYSLGASKAQIMRHVIVPNSLPELFTGARVAIGVCWGTVVAAELVAAERGIGMTISVASKFQNTDIVIVGIILIGIIGFSIDVFMRLMERRLVPWKGRS